MTKTTRNLGNFNHELAAEAITVKIRWFGLCVGYVLVTGFATSLGYGRTLPPVVAAWAPNMLCGVLAAFLGWRVWQRT